MTMNKKTSPQENKRLSLIGKLMLFVAIGASICLMLTSIRSDWGQPVMYLCVFYTLAVVLFFIAQLVGFVASQTTYSEAVEAPKFSMLELEAEEWKNYEKS